MDLEQVLSFSFRDAEIRGVVAQLGPSYQELTRQHAVNEADISQTLPEHPLFIRQLLGEMGLAVAMMGSNLKIPGKLSLQIRGTGRIKDAFVELSLPADVAEQEDLSTPPSSFKIRGIVRIDDNTPQPDAIDLREWAGDKSVLAITILPDHGQSYQGVVGLEKSRFMHCLEDYYTQSEQIPTRFWFQSTHEMAAGFMLQQLPPTESTQAAANTIDWQTALTLAGTIRADELIKSKPVDLLFNLFHEFPPLVHQQKRLEYECSCTESRLKKGLLSLGVTEIQALVDEPQLQVNCNICGQSYTFDTQALLQEVIELHS